MESVGLVGQSVGVGRGVCRVDRGVCRVYMGDRQQLIPLSLLYMEGSGRNDCQLKVFG